MNQFKHNEAVYQITRTAPLNYTFKAHGATVSTTGEDLDAEFGTNTTAWAQYIDEALCESGQVVWSDDFDCYVTPDGLDEMKREAGWEREHIRQESRSDIFI